MKDNLKYPYVATNLSFCFDKVGLVGKQRNDSDGALGLKVPISSFQIVINS